MQQVPACIPWHHDEQPIKNYSAQAAYDTMPCYPAQTRFLVCIWAAHVRLVQCCAQQTLSWEALPVDDAVTATLDERWETHVVYLMEGVMSRSDTEEVESL